MKKRPYLKYILGIVLVGILAGGGYGYYLWTKPFADICSKKPDFVLDAAALFTEFQKDETAANKKYLGEKGVDKIIEVTGVVTKVDTTGQTRPKSGAHISLETGDMMGAIYCELDSHGKKQEVSCKVGDKIVIKGIITGYLSDVQLSRCCINQGK